MVAVMVREKFGLKKSLQKGSVLNETIVKRRAGSIRCLRTKKFVKKQTNGATARSAPCFKGHTPAQSGVAPDPHPSGER